MQFGMCHFSNHKDHNEKNRDHWSPSHALALILALSVIDRHHEAFLAT